IGEVVVLDERVDAADRAGQRQRGRRSTHRHAAAAGGGKCPARHREGRNLVPTFTVDVAEADAGQRKGDIDRAVQRRGRAYLRGVVYVRHGHVGGERRSALTAVGGAAAVHQGEGHGTGGGGRVFGRG